MRQRQSVVHCRRDEGKGVCPRCMNLKVGSRFAQRAAIGSFITAPDPEPVTVSGKPSVDIPPGTLNSALKQAGLKKPE